MTAPDVYIRDTDRSTIGDTASWESLTLHPVRNDVGRWTLVTRDAEAARVLSPPLDSNGKPTGARGVILRQGGETIDSGWCDGAPDVSNDGSVTEWTFSGWTDTVIMADTLCWPKPDQPIDQQTDAYHTLGGPASTRIRAYAIDNVVQRLQIPGFATGNDLQLGPNHTSRARFRNLLELSQAIAKRDLNFQIRQRDADRALFLYQWLPLDKRLSVQFSPALGTVHGWSHTFTPAEVTRVVVGAGDEGAARGFREYVGHVSEGELGGVRKVERFIDRRDLSLMEDGEPTDWEDEAQEAAVEALNEGISRASFTIEMTGEPGYEYGVDYFIGDLVRAYIDQDENAQPVGLVDDLIEEVEITWSSEGERARVSVGSLDENAPNRASRRLERRLRLLQRDVHGLKTRR